MRGRRRYREPRRYAPAPRCPRRRSSYAVTYLTTAGPIGAIAGGWAMTDPDRQQAFISNAKGVAIDAGMKHFGIAGGRNSWEEGSVKNAATHKFAPEVRTRAARMVLDNKGDHPSRWAAIVSISAGIPPGGTIFAADDRPHYPRRVHFISDSHSAPRLSSIQSAANGSNPDPG